MLVTSRCNNNVRIIVWGKFHRYFCVKIAYGNTFLSLWVSDKIFLIMNYFQGQTFCSVADELNALLYLIMHSFNMHFVQAQTHNDNEYNIVQDL